MFVVWALTGLWHGASWNFLFWGLYFFVFLMLEKLFLKKLLDKLPVLSNLYTLLVVFIGWILFRNSDMQLGLAVFRGLFGLNGNPITNFAATTLVKNNLYILLFSCLASTPLLRFLCRKLGEALERSRAGSAVWIALSCWLLPIGLLILSTMGLVGNSYNPFIYFQF